MASEDEVQEDKSDIQQESPDVDQSPAIQSQDSDHPPDLGINVTDDFASGDVFG